MSTGMKKQKCDKPALHMFLIKCLNIPYQAYIRNKLT